MSSQEQYLNASVSFDVNEVRERCFNENDPNVNAWNNLYGAMCTPDFFPNEKIREGKYYQMLYPVSKAETEEMERRLEAAENAQQAPDHHFTDILAEMKDIVKWSKTKHFNCLWKSFIAYLIVCPFIPFLLMSGTRSINLAEVKHNMALVQSWEEKDVYFTQDQTKEIKVSYEDCYNTAYNYKYRVLSLINERIENERSVISSGTPQQVEKKKKELKNDLAMFDQENKKTAKEMKEEVLGEFQKDVDEHNRNKAIAGILNIFLLLLIPLYLLSCYQYGYNINRFINFRESMNQLFKVGGAVAAAGAAAGTVVEVTHWNDGSETRDYHNPGWPLVLAGLIMILFTAVIVLLFSTINGLYYNYIKVHKKTDASISALSGNVEIEEAPRNKILTGVLRILGRNISKIFITDGREGSISYLVYMGLIWVITFMMMKVCIGNVMVFIFFGFTLLVAIFASSCRRMHDIGLSSKLLLVVFFVPFLIFILPFIPGNKEANKYGPAPKSDFE